MPTVLITGASKGIGRATALQLDRKGFTVLAGAFAVGSVSGALFNPAVAVAAVILGMMPAQTIWLYVIAELLGGTLAAFVFRFLNPDDL